MRARRPGQDARLKPAVEHWLTTGDPSLMMRQQIWAVLDLPPAARVAELEGDRARAIAILAASPVARYLFDASPGRL